MTPSPTPLPTWTPTPTPVPGQSFGRSASTYASIGDACVNGGSYPTAGSIYLANDTTPNVGDYFYSNVECTVLFDGGNQKYKIFRGGSSWGVEIGSGGYVSSVVDCSGVSATPTPTPTSTPVPPTATPIPPTATPTPTPCPLAGEYVGQFCSGYDLYYTYTNGSCGTYNQLVESNSGTCGYIEPTATPTPTPIPPTATPTPTPEPSGLYTVFTSCVDGSKYYYTGGTLLPIDGYLTLNEYINQCVYADGNFSNPQDASIGDPVLPFTYYTDTSSCIECV
jgi:hypothetical protein